MIKYLKSSIPAPVKNRIRKILNEKRFRREKKSILRLTQFKALPQNIELLRSSNKAVFFEIRDSFTIDDIRNELRLDMENLLNEKEVLYWVLPSQSNRPSIIGIQLQDVTKILEHVQNDPAFKFWYADLLDEKGKVFLAGVQIQKIPSAGKFFGLRIYKRIAYKLNYSFRTGAFQGIELSIWTKSVNPETKEDCLRPQVWNENVSMLPIPSNAPVEFQDSVLRSSLPNVALFSQPIDVVYTWVDGADPVWSLNKELHLGSGKADNLVTGSSSVYRYKNNDELKFSLRSIHQFAPWVNKIFLVTDNQVPDWLIQSEKIVVVDHKEIFANLENLPTFNSHAIESCLHRIPGLNEYFLYFNDDVLLTRPISPDLFFYPNGISKVFWSRAQIDFSPRKKTENSSTIAAKNALRILSERNDLYFNRKFYHAPAALRKSICHKLESEFPLEYAATRASRFRSDSDIAAAGSFYFNYGLSRGHVVPGRIRYDYIDPSTLDGRQRMARLLANRNYDCVVINDGASTEDEFHYEDDSYIGNSLSELLPIKAPWEK